MCPAACVACMCTTVCVHFATHIRLTAHICIDACVRERLAACIRLAMCTCIAARIAAHGAFVCPAACVCVVVCKHAAVRICIGVCVHARLAACIRLATCTCIAARIAARGAFVCPAARVCLAACLCTAVRVCVVACMHVAIRLRIAASVHRLFARPMLQHLEHRVGLVMRRHELGELGLNSSELGVRALDVRSGRHVPTPDLATGSKRGPEQTEPPCKHGV